MVKRKGKIPKDTRDRPKTGTKAAQRPSPEGLWFMVGLLIVAIVIIVAFYVFIILPRAEEVGVGENLSIGNESGVIITNSVSVKVRSMEECLAEYNLSADTVFFFYGADCPYSQKMMPYVSELEAKGYKFFWVESSNGSALQITSDCLYGIADLGNVPEFICPAKRVNNIGTFPSLEEMEIFAANCK